VGSVNSILGNPRYTGFQVWNRQRTDAELIDPADVALGHKPVQRWNLPDGRVISARPTHEARVSEAGFIAAQAIAAARGPAPVTDRLAPANLRRYMLSGLLTCETYGRRMESAWSNGKPAYRRRHGHTSADSPDPGRRRTLTSASRRSLRNCSPCASRSPPWFGGVGGEGQNVLGLQRQGPSSGSGSGLLRAEARGGADRPA